MIKRTLSLFRNYRVLVKTMLEKQDGFGRDEILGTAAVLIIAAFITIPRLTDFVQLITTTLNSWWTNTVASKIFPGSI